MTILSESTQKISTSTVWTFFVLAIIAFAITILLLLDEYYKLGLVFLAITIALFVIMSFCIEPHRKIKVILSDDYPAVELLDKYTVDGNEGEIWTLIEREPMRKQEDEE